MQKKQTKVKEIVSKEMNIAEVVEKYPQTREIFFDLGLGCVGCVASSFETLEEGLLAHGLDVDEVLKKLNNSLK